jgi:hypothetical protein
MTPPCPLPDWEHPVFEDAPPKVRYVWTDDTPLDACEPVLVNNDTYPMVGGWEAGQVRGRE